MKRLFPHLILSVTVPARAATMSCESKRQTPLPTLKREPFSALRLPLIFGTDPVVSRDEEQNRLRGVEVFVTFDFRFVSFYSIVG